MIAGWMPKRAKSIRSTDMVVGSTLRSPLVYLGLTLTVVFVLSLFIGRYPQPYWMSPTLLEQDELARQLVLNLRLPRMLVAMLLGMSLAGAGAVMQMIFRNPLVEPGFLGVSQGAAFGAALAFVFIGSSPLIVEGLAATFAALGMVFSYFLARYLRFGGWILRLILSGIIISALFSSGVGALKYVADPLRELPTLTFWLLGGLWSVTWNDLIYILPLVLPSLVVIYLMRWRLNLLSLNDETAFSLGISPARERLLLLSAAVLSTAAVVAVAGIVGWIGLIVPHIARRLMGSNAAAAIPAAILIGGILGLICDTVARSAIAGEIPLGILTALIGAVAFSGLMMTNRVRSRE